VIRLAWRQFRSEAMVAVAALVAVAVVLGITGPHLVHVFDTGRAEVTTTDVYLQNALAALLLIVPALLGIFFGAPLVARELETGSFRLAWTQSVTRSRWLVVKFAIVGVSASLVAGSLSLMAAWWANPINIVNQSRFSPADFGMFGIVPFGYGLFAFALGATTGLIFRRMLPAMATTLVGYAAVRVAVTYLVRPHFQPPLSVAVALTKLGNYGFVRSPSGSLSMQVFPPTLPDAWALSASVVDKAGHAPTSEHIKRACPSLFQGPGGKLPFPKAGGLPGCVAHLAARFHEVVTYQPASRYWPFQIYETVLFLVLAVALGALSVWWARRRLV
jgi:hypothetical protein